eukprot:1153234-Pelagomonas_calceolata.AAC.4
MASAHLLLADQPQVSKEKNRKDNASQKGRAGPAASLRLNQFVAQNLPAVLLQTCKPLQPHLWLAAGSPRPRDDGHAREIVMRPQGAAVILLQLGGADLERGHGHQHILHEAAVGAVVVRCMGDM